MLNKNQAKSNDAETRKMTSRSLSSAVYVMATMLLESTYLLISFLRTNRLCHQVYN